MATRRQALKGLTLGAGATLLNPMIQRVLANENGEKTPPRFVFVLQSNGFDAIQACPESIPFQKYSDCEKFETFDLTKHTLPKGFSPLKKHKKRVTILQGLSGKSTGGGHSTWSGALGQFRLSGANNSDPLGVTIDYQLGTTIPGILPWIGVGMSANENQTATLGFSGRAAHKPLAIALNPEKAYNAYFSVAASGDLKKRFHLKRNLLDYMIDDVKRTQKQLGPLGGIELEAYLDSYDSLARRQYKLLSAEDQLTRAAPKPDDRFTSSVATKRMEAQFEIASSALIGGLSNVATITCAAGEINAQPYLGIGLEESNHGFGHMGGSARDARGIPLYEQSRSFLMRQIATMVDRLESMPEGEGTMMDNTLIVYLSDAADRHHARAYEWPMIVIGDLGGRLKTAGRYLRYPWYGQKGHRTVANLYTSLLHAVGDRRERFGLPDLALQDVDQEGPLTEVLA